VSTLLNSYWLKFDPPVAMSPIGVGVTAYSIDDAMGLLAAELRKDVLKPVAVIENVAMADLDQGHVVPNMHPITARGVWFPKLSAFH
jgi:hypothetical protein